MGSQLQQEIEDDERKVGGRSTVLAEVYEPGHGRG
jgi:hypothetical protein